jgi:hypothetical protein
LSKCKIIRVSCTTGRVWSEELKTFVELNTNVYIIKMDPGELRTADSVNWIYVVQDKDVMNRIRVGSSSS